MVLIIYSFIIYERKSVRDFLGFRQIEIGIASCIVLAYVKPQNLGKFWRWRRLHGFNENEKSDNKKMPILNWNPNENCRQTKNDDCLRCSVRKMNSRHFSVLGCPNKQRYVLCLCWYVPTKILSETSRLSSNNRRYSTFFLIKGHADTNYSWENFIYVTSG